MISGQAHQNTIHGSIVWEIYKFLAWSTVAQVWVRGKYLSANLATTPSPDYTCAATYWMVGVNWVLLLGSGCSGYPEKQSRATTWTYLKPARILCFYTSTTHATAEEVTCSDKAQDNEEHNIVTVETLGMFILRA